MLPHLNEPPSTTYETSHYNCALTLFKELKDKHPNGEYKQVTPNVVYFVVESTRGSDTISSTWFLRQSQVKHWEELNVWEGREEWEANTKEEEV
jgi:hypothetical protein